MSGIPPTPNNIPLAASLPKVSFRKIPPEEAFLLNVPAGVIESQMVGFGFNDGSAFEKPDHYMRFVEPVESELKRQVEYDMDEQDQEWLEVLNADRRRDGLDTITYETFETILDQIEKEWFDLIKRIPPKVRPGGADNEGQDAGSDEGEDSMCAICDDGECENSNAIVFCDGCNLAVHQDCYGIPYIPEGQWLCRKCTVSPDRAVSCILCPHEGGAFKQTTTGKWAHLICAMWIPETGVSNPVYMEPIDSIDRIPKARWRLQCYLCRHKTGACIQCDNRSCFTAFHVTCARKAGLLFKTERTRVVSHQPSIGSDVSDTETSDVLRACCHKHIPHGMKDQLKINFRRHSGIDEEHSEGSMRGSPFATPRTREQSYESSKGAPFVSVSRRSSLGTSGSNTRTSKSARAYKKSFKSGPPLVPAYIANRVLEYISKISLRKKSVAVQLIARYWSLKREARRGAPLLKRLHLEPWTASSQNKEQTDTQKVKKLLFLRSLREDLERVRMLVEQVRKREREKLRQAQQIRTSLVERLLFPYHDKLRAALARFEAVDKYGFFTASVSKVDVPDYYDIIKEPMEWNTIRAKISDKRYTSILEMKLDVLRVSTNAMIYNKPDTPYHKVASKVSKLVPDVFDELEHLDSAHIVDFQSKMPVSRPAELGDTTQNSENSPANLQDLQALGLEAPMSHIALLKDYDKTTDGELIDVRADAYQQHTPTFTKDLMPEVTTDNTDAVTNNDRAPKERSPVLNLMEDFVSQIYVPAPLSESSEKGNKKSSAAVSRAGEAVASKKTKRRRFSVTDDSTRGSERRSSRRLQPDNLEGMATDADSQQPPIYKRRRTDALEPTDSGTSVDVVQGTEDPIQVKGGVGDHDSFLLFNSGWVYPEGAKRNRSTPLKVETVTQRPRKSSAPESVTKNKLGTVPTLTKTPQRPRSATTASASRRGTLFASSEPKQKTSIRTTPKATQADRDSSPLTSADEGKGNDKQEEESQKVAESPMTASQRYNLFRRERRAQERTERLKQEALAIREDRSDGVSSMQPPTQESSPARRSTRTNARFGSELSKEEDGAVDTHKETQKSRGSTSSSKQSLATPTERKSPSRSRGQRCSPSKAVVDKEDSDNGSAPLHGTMVWAKVEGHPHFPAKIVADQDEISKEQLLAQPDFAPPLRPSGPSSLSDAVAKQRSHHPNIASPLRRSSHPNAVKLKSRQSGSRPPVNDGTAPIWVLVAFYDKGKTWRWLPSYKVVPMHVDDDTDSRMLRLPRKHASAKKNVREAYEQAKRSL